MAICIGGVGEGQQCALVGGDDEIWSCIRVMAHDIMPQQLSIVAVRLRAVGNNVVGEVEQPVHQDLVALDPFGLDTGPVARRALEDETTL